MKKLSSWRFGKKKNLLVLFIVLLLFSLTLPLSHAFSKEEILKYKIRSPTVSRVTHEITIINEGAFQVENVKVWIPIIKNETPHHFALIENITLSRPYGNFENDSSNNTYIFWKIDRISPGKLLKVKIEYSILSFSTQYLINADAVGEYSKESWLYRNYTRSEKFIESDDAFIVEAAKSIAGDETNPHILALKIADFVSKNLAYKAQDEERGAVWALEHGEGDCSEFSYLFTALCRACGIPARVKAGVAFHSNAEETSFGHMWAEYFLPNYGWIPIDLTWNQICYQNSLHFSLLHSFPIRYPYDTVFIECSAPLKASIGVYQTIRISPGSIADFEGFTLARLTYDVLSKAETMKSLNFIVALMGARVFTPQDYADLEAAIEEFYLMIQQLLETNDLGRIQQANLQIEYILSLGERVIFKCGIMLALIVLIMILIVYALSLRRWRIEGEPTF